MKALIIYDVDNVVEDSQIIQMGREFAKEGHRVVVVSVPEEKLTELLVNTGNAPVTITDPADNAAKYMYGMFKGNTGKMMLHIMQSFSSPEAFPATTHAVNILITDAPMSESVIEETGIDNSIRSMIKTLYGYHHNKTK